MTSENQAGFKSSLSYQLCVTMWWWWGCQWESGGGLAGSELCLDSGVFIIKMMGLDQVRVFPIFLEQWNPFCPLHELSSWFLIHKAGKSGASLNEAGDGCWARSHLRLYPCYSLPPTRDGHWDMSLEPRSPWRRQKNTGLGTVWCSSKYYQTMKDLGG